MASDARAFPRLRCRLPAWAESRQGPVRGLGTNLSLGGLFLEGVDLRPGLQTLVGLEHPAIGRFTAQAMVRHHGVSPSGSGVQFIRLDPQQQAMIRKLVALVG